MVLAFAGQLLLLGSVTWTQALLFSLRDWYPWLLLGPLAVWLALRFPLERHKLAVSIPIHALACIAAVIFYGLMVPRPLPGGRGPFGGGPQFRFRGGPGPEQLPAGPRENEARQRPPSGEGLGENPFPPRHAPDERTIFLNRTVMHARFNVPIYWVIVSVAHALTYYRRSQERERAALELEGRLSEAKLQSLRMQLHPHFLFNTLNAISTLVHKDPAAADEMIGNLSELLRATLDTAEQEIPLREEMAFLDRYLEIQQVRFGERLKIERRIDVQALKGRVPALILQPLVENAIRHGIEPQPGSGLVSIRAEVKEGTLQLEILDNGQGLQGGFKQPEGIGLANTRARLQALYGNAAHLVLQSGAEGGCLVQVQLPFRDEDTNLNRG